MKDRSEDHVLPRPVERLPDYAQAGARRTAAEKLCQAFGLGEAAALTAANAAVDPAALRKQIVDPADPQVERIRVTGGELLGIRTMVWTRKVMPDPRNPRTGPGRSHPFAVDPGMGGEDSKFRPIPEPRMSDPKRPALAELTVDIDSREHLDWGSQQAAAYVFATNDWRPSIRSQGVMEAVWLVPTTYVAVDGSEPVTALVTVEGSSRITAAHDVIGVRSADVPYERNDFALRANINRLNDRLMAGADAKELNQMRCEIVPALIIVGFKPHATSETGFPTAVKSWVALRHVDAPKPWGEGPEYEALADETLDELYRRGLVSAAEKAYYTGSCTKAEAQAAHLSPDPTRRAASIVRLLTDKRPEIREAIRTAVTSQSTRKKINSAMLTSLASALILRGVNKDPERKDQIRRYMRYAFSQAVFKSDWKATGRDTVELVRDARRELQELIARGDKEDENPASIELAVRAAYALIADGRLAADRGTANNTQPDRRTPGEVLDAIRQAERGILQLGQALQDIGEGGRPRAVDEDGAIRKDADGRSDLIIRDEYLRHEFPAAGQWRSARPDDTPLIRHRNMVGRLGDAITQMHNAFMELAVEMGSDGQPMVDSHGVDQKLCATWKGVLQEMGDSLAIWGRNFQRRFGGGEAPRPAQTAAPDEDSLEAEWRRRQEDRREGPEEDPQPA